VRYRSSLPAPNAFNRQPIVSFSIGPLNGIEQALDLGLCANPGLAVVDREAFIDGNGTDQPMQKRGETQQMITLFNFFAIRYWLPLLRSL
jgi:hypothetical protein